MKEHKKKLHWSILPLIILILDIVWMISIFSLNKYSLVLSVPDEPLKLEYGVDILPEVTALCKGTLLSKNGVPVETTINGTVNLQELGTYELTYSAEYTGIHIEETRTFIVQDTLPPTIELVADPEHFTSPVAQYEEEGYQAVDNYDGDITSQVIRVEHDGIVTYTATDSSGNTSTIDRIIIYKDVIPPVITLTAGSSTTCTIGSTFQDPGFTASDDVDGDITSQVVVEGHVDSHTAGTYKLTYRVQDSSANPCEIVRTVKVGDFVAPTITLHGDTNAYILVGTSYSDPGFSAVDNIDGDVTSKVSVSGSIDTSKTGRNNITYTVTDAAGNTATATRSVLVYKKQAVADTVNPGDKVVYLTFDDGPGQHTARLLNTLDKFGVKATFFVTNQFPKYQYLIGEAHRRGHTIALHTATHQFSQIYSSETAYYNDLETIHNICVAQTGVTPTIVRFPGGTNNAVSKQYCAGLMTTLTQSLSYHGYLYCDWNVNSSDAGGTTSVSTVASNVISGIKRHNVSIVLQHDIKGYSVDAVEQIIYWGLENGYTFLPLTNSSPMHHFAPKN
jgi:peptidoglycan/xylan/chitin deacetylase (PgdA/CDA1 family)